MQKRHFKRLLVFVIALVLLVPTGLVGFADDAVYGGGKAGGGHMYFSAARTTLGPDSPLASSAGSYTWRVELPILGFFNAYVDGEQLERGVDYTVRDGSTVVTLSNSYISTLAPGDYRLRLEFVASDVVFDFTVGAISDWDLDEPVEKFPTSPSTISATAGSDPADSAEVDGEYYDDDIYDDTQNPDTGIGQGVWALLSGDWGVQWLHLALAALAALIACLGLWAVIPRRRDEMVTRD